jgi:hypothetical protein
LRYAGALSRSQWQISSNCRPRRFGLQESACRSVARSAMSKGPARDTDGAAYGAGVKLTLRYCRHRCSTPSFGERSRTVCLLALQPVRQWGCTSGLRYAPAPLLRTAATARPHRPSRSFNTPRTSYWPSAARLANSPRKSSGSPTQGVRRTFDIQNEDCAMISPTSSSTW